VVFFAPRRRLAGERWAHVDRLLEPPLLVATKEPFVVARVDQFTLGHVEPP
jgi:hypothetical protein